MRILVVTPYFYPHSGGSQRYIEELYGAVRRLDPKIKVDVVTYNTEGRKKRETYKGMTVYRVGAWEVLRGQFSLPNYVELVQLVRKLRARKYDVVNAHTRFFDTGWWGFLAARYLGAKAVLTDHCASHPAHASGWVRGVARVVDEIAVPVLGRCYDGVVVVSRATAKFWRDRGIKRVEVVYGGVEVKGQSASKDKVRMVPGMGRMSKNAVMVGFVGRLIGSKGPELVAQVAREITAVYPQVYFGFAGAGELERGLKKYESGRVKFLGNLAREEVTKLLKATDILVHPSEHHEGLPSVLLEAGAAGCAVVATNAGGTGELIKDGITGVMVKPEVRAIRASVERLINDKQRRVKLGRALRERVRGNFDGQVIAKKYLKYLKQLAA